MVIRSKVVARRSRGTSTESPRAPASSPTTGQARRPGKAPVPDRLPLTLRAYALLTAAATPLAPHLLKRRLRRGKEHPQRLAERRGEATARRPSGTLVWVHGASVGELAAAIPLIERLR